MKENLKKAIAFLLAAAVSAVIIISLMSAPAYIRSAKQALNGGYDEDAYDRYVFEHELSGDLSITPEMYEYAVETSGLHINTAEGEN